jgi:serine/threonine-protein kinase
MVGAAASHLLAGKYRLIAELGAGGMAKVFLAITEGDLSFRKLSVVKLMRPELLTDPSFATMFLEEARLAARLDHPNIVNTYDVGHSDDGYFIAMEYLDGVSLHSIVREFGFDGEFTFAMYARVLVEVLAALEHAHTLRDFDGRPLRVVHRDVSPHNVVITFAGQVKLLDFGIAKAADSAVQTSTGVVKGKVAYMAPEQAAGGRDIDGRADNYAVGVMLWEAAAGARRYPGKNNLEILGWLLGAEAAPPANAAQRGLPSAVDVVLDKALAPHRDQRYASASEFAAELEFVLKGMSDVPSLRQIGEVLSTRFGEERSRMRRRIEEACSEAANGTQPRELPTVRPPGRPKTGEVTAVSDPEEGTRPAAAPERGDGGVVEGTSVTAARRLARSGASSVVPTRAPPIRAFVAAAGVAVLGASAFAVMRVGTPSVEATAGAATREGAAVASAGPAAAAEQLVELSVLAEPETAEVEVDGVKLSGRPAKVSVARGTEPRTITVTAPGYVPVRREVVPSASQSLEVKLDRETTKDSPTAARGRAPSRAGARPPPALGAPPVAPSSAPPAPKDVTERPARRTPESLDTDDPWSR